MLSENGWGGGFIIHPMDNTYGEIRIKAPQIDVRFNPIVHVLLDALKYAGFDGTGASSDTSVKNDDIQLIIGTRWSNPLQRNLKTE